MNQWLLLLIIILLCLVVFPCSYQSPWFNSSFRYFLSSLYSFFSLLYSPLCFFFYSSLCVYNNLSCVIHQAASFPSFTSFQTRHFLAVCNGCYLLPPPFCFPSCHPSHSVHMCLLDYNASFLGRLLLGLCVP